MPSIFTRIYDKFIGTIKNIMDRFGTERDVGEVREPIGLEREPRVPLYEITVAAGLVDPITVTQWTTIANLDRTSNRFRDTRTGLFMSGPEYRSKQSAWRSGMLDAMINKNFPYLDAGERARVIDAIENVRASDATPAEKDDIIRDLIGSP